VKSFYLASSSTLLNENIFDLLVKEDVTEIKRIIRLLPDNESRGLTYLAKFKNSNDDSPLKVEVKKTERKEQIF
jgi:hypothetical protein